MCFESRPCITIFLPINIHCTQMIWQNMSLTDNLLNLALARPPCMLRALVVIPIRYSVFFGSILTALVLTTNNLVRHLRQQQRLQFLDGATMEVAEDEDARGAGSAGSMVISPQIVRSGRTVHPRSPVSPSQCLCNRLNPIFHMWESMWPIMSSQ